MKVSLKELGDIITGNTPSKKNKEYWDSDDVGFVKPDILNDKELTYIENTNEYISDVAKAKARIVTGNSILITCIGIIGKIGIVKRGEYAFNQQINAIIPNDKVYPDYLAYNLLFNKPKLVKIANAPVVPIINKSQFAEFDINIDDRIENQLKVVAVLDKMSLIIKKRKAKLVKLDTLIKSRFVEMFGDLKKNDMGWKICSFTDFAQIDTTMIRDFEEYGDYPHIGIDSIEKETGNISGYRTVREDGVISGKYLFTPDHIIYSKIRPNLNKVALPSFKGVCSADAYPILPQKERCNRIFLAYTMRSTIFLDYILAFSNRTNLPKVNKLQVEGFHCPMPDVALQNQFATFVQQVDKLKFDIQQSIDKAQLLFDSLMQEYFG